MGGGELTPAKDVIYGKDTLTYSWDYNDNDTGFHEVAFNGFTINTKNFSIGDDRNNTFITVGQNADILKKWFPKLDLQHCIINEVEGSAIPPFNGVQFDWLGVKDNETGKWLSGRYIWVYFKKNNNNQWVISKIQTYIFSDAYLID